MALPNERFLNKIFVDKNIKQLVEEDLLWEKYVRKQTIDSQVALYYREQYMDIETPNDAAFTSKVLDPFGARPGYRAEGAMFPHADIGAPKEFSIRLYQLALEIDYTEEEMKFATMENRVLKKQEKLANYFASSVNAILGDALTESWNPVNINEQPCSPTYEWDGTNAQPVKDILGAEEKIADTPGFNYKPDTLFVTKQSYYDLLNYIVKNDYSFGYETLEGGKQITKVLGHKVVVSNMVKRDKAVLADLRQAGIMFECDPFETEVYKTQEDRKYHIQATRRFNYALTDPKAVCLITNVSA